MHTRYVSDVGYMIPGVDSTCRESFPQTLWAILVFFGIFEFFKKFFFLCHSLIATDGAENVSMLGLILKF